MACRSMEKESGAGMVAMMMETEDNPDPQPMIDALGRWRWLRWKLLGNLRIKNETVRLPADRMVHFRTLSLIGDATFRPVAPVLVEQMNVRGHGTIAFGAQATFVVLADLTIRERTWETESAWSGTTMTMAQG